MTIDELRRKMENLFIEFEEDIEDKNNLKNNSLECLDDVIQEIICEIENTKDWMCENEELTINKIESEGYVRGLMFVLKNIKCYNIGEEILKEKDYKL